MTILVLNVRLQFSLRQLVIVFVVFPQVVPVRDGLVGACEDWARARAVGLADEALAFERVEDGGGATVADAQAALKDGGRGALHLAADPQRLLEQLVALARGAVRARGLFLRLRDGLVVDRLAALRLYVSDYLADLVLVEVRAVHAQKARGSGREKEHVAATE